jgi:hypothetical protein
MGCGCLLEAKKKERYFYLMLGISDGGEIKKRCNARANRIGKASLESFNESQYHRLKQLQLNAACQFRLSDLLGIYTVIQTQIYVISLVVLVIVMILCPQDAWTSLITVSSSSLVPRSHAASYLSGPRSDG